MYKDAIAAAKDADFVIYRTVTSSILVEVSTGEVIANVTDAARDIVAAGISAQRKSLYDFDAGHFVCGTLDQMEG